MKKLLFGITSLSYGGAERVLVDICNRLKDEYDITIMTIYAKGELEKQLDKKIKIHSVYDKSFNEYTKREVRKISYDLIKNIEIREGYDTVIAFLEGPMTRLFAKYPGRKIAWVHNDISKVFGTGLVAKIKKRYDGKAYEKYDKIIFVSDENKEDFIKEYENKIKIDEIKLQRIYNYIDYKRILYLANVKESNKELYNKKDINIVTVARLTKQKAFDRLIRVVSKLKDTRLDAKIYIVGDGPERKNLEKLIKENEVEDRVFLLGAKDNPYPYVKEADYFALLSYYEGYGMVLDEAKILNKKLLITKTAAVEAVKDYVNCYKIENNEEAIYEGLKKVILNDKIEDEEINSYNTIENYYEKIIEEIRKIM